MQPLEGELGAGEDPGAQEASEIRVSHPESRTANRDKKKIIHKFKAQTVQILTSNLPHRASMKLTETTAAALTTSSA